MSRFIGLGLVAVMLLATGCVADPYGYGGYGGYPGYGGGYGYPSAGYVGGSPYYGGATYANPYCAPYGGTTYGNPYYYNSGTTYPTYPYTNGGAVTNPQDPNSLAARARQRYWNYYRNRQGGGTATPTVTPSQPTVNSGTPLQGPQAQIARRMYMNRTQTGGAAAPMLRQQAPLVRQQAPAARSFAPAQTAKPQGGLTPMITK